MSEAPGIAAVSPRVAASPSPAPVRRGLGMLVVMIGVLIAAIDGTVVVLALPAIEHDLHIRLVSITWVVVAYLLVVTVLATQVGRLGDMYGRVRMYEAGFVVFVLGSVLCALSWDAASLIGFRVLQGLGAALIAANSGAVIAELYPPQERGRAYGFNALGFSSPTCPGAGSSGSTCPSGCSHCCWRPACCGTTARACAGGSTRWAWSPWGSGSSACCGL
jgi:MFS family permease